MDSRQVANGVWVESWRAGDGKVQADLVLWLLTRARCSSGHYNRNKVAQVACKIRR